MILSSPNLKSINVVFDDQNLVANAGLLAIATLSQSLGLQELIEEKVSLSGRVGGANPGRKLLTLIHAMTAGANHIDHVDMLRAGSTGSVLGHVVVAPSTMGTFLRSFTFGHVRQLDSVVDIARCVLDMGNRGVFMSVDPVRPPRNQIPRISPGRQWLVAKRLFERSYLWHARHGRSMPTSLGW